MPSKIRTAPNITTKQGASIGEEIGRPIPTIYPLPIILIEQSNPLCNELEEYNYYCKPNENEDFLRNFKAILSICFLQNPLK